MKELEARATAAEKACAAARTSLQNERQLRASAELRQRELLRQLQEQEDELGRAQRRGEYTRTLEDKVSELQEQLSCGSSSGVADGASDISGSSRGPRRKTA